MLTLLIASIALRTRPISFQVDFSQPRQRIDNFAASDCWSIEPLYRFSEATRKKVADLLFSTTHGAGLSGWRFNIPGGINHETINNEIRTADTYEPRAGLFNWEANPGQRWMLRAAYERGVRQFVAFANTPPSWLTENGFTNCTDGLGTTNLKKGGEAQFARYLCDVVAHLGKQEGVPFTEISPINEPAWEWNGVPTKSSQEGCRYSNDDIARVVEALHAEMGKRNLTARILTPEATAPNAGYENYKSMSDKYKAKYCDYIDDFASRPGFLDTVNPIYGYHSYWADHLDHLVPDREKLATALKKTPSMPVWMTEYCQMQGPHDEGGHGRDLTMKTALNVARIIHLDLTVVGASAWQWWLSVSNVDFKDGLIYVDRFDDPHEHIYASRLLWALGNFARFIRPGWRRVECSGPFELEGVLASAYTSPDGKQAAIVLINQSDEQVSVDLRLNGLTKRQWIPYITSDEAGDELRKVMPVDLDSPYLLHPKSVVTLVRS